MKKHKVLRCNTTAVTSVILALLLLGLIAVTLTTIHMVYVPKWIAQREGMHMHEVGNQLAELKHTLDIQAVTKDKTSIMTPITLGIEQQSFLTTSRAYGSIHLLSDDIVITVTNTTEQQTFILDTIQYSSSNNHYVDQSYILEGGGLIKSQIEGDVMISALPVLYNFDGYDLSFTIYNLSHRGGKTDMSGYGTYFLQTNYTNSTTYNLTDITTFEIQSKYPNSWFLYLNKTVQEIGLVYGTEYEITKTESNVLLTLLGSSDVDIHIDLVKIFTQLGLGLAG